MSSDGAGVFRALTAAGQDRGGSLAFEQFSAFGAGFEGSGSAPGAVRFEALTASATGRAPFSGSASASFEALTGTGIAKRDSGGTFAPLTASAIGLVGMIGSGAGRFEALGSTGHSFGPHLSDGAASLQPMIGTGVGRATSFGSASLVLRPLQVSASGLVGGVGRAALSLSALSAAVTGHPYRGGGGAIALPRMGAYASGDENLTSQLDAWAMNLRTNAVSRYPSYPVNSFASYNGTYLGAGPNGLLLLNGGGDADEDGSGISWLVRTGQLDDKSPVLKRMTEVLLGCRYDGPVRVRIWKDDDTYYDYSLPNLRPSTLQQVRAKLGKGVRSRYYKVELSAVGTRFEMDSLQATMPRLTRRAG